MKILFLAINSKYVHTLLAPYYLRANCDEKDIFIMQTNINVDTSIIIDFIEKYKPDVITASVYIFNILKTEEVLLKVKKIFPWIKIVLGGPEVSFEYENNYAYADNIIVGEGESAYSSLMRAYRLNLKVDRIIKGEPLELNYIKSPFTKEYFSDCKGKIAYFEASRGCPFTCAYCMSGGSRLRYFSKERVFSDLEKFKGADIRVLKFVDRTFNANNRFACDILKYIIDNNKSYKFPFHFEIAGDLITDEFLSLVEIAPKNLFSFEIGVQSFNEKTLEAIARKTDLQKVKLNIKRLVDIERHHIHTDLIAGLPLENLSSFKQSFNTLYELNSDMLQLGFLKVLKGSAIKLQLDKDYVYGENPPYEIISTPYLTKVEIAELKLVEQAVDKYYNSGNFKMTLKHFISGDPYEFYLTLAKSEKSTTLFERVATIYKFLLFKNFNFGEVSSYLLADYLLTNNSRVIPPALKVYDPDFAKLLSKMGINKKKLFCIKLEFNPFENIKEKGVLALDYSKTPFEKYFYKISD